MQFGSSVFFLNLLTDPEQPNTQAVMPNSRDPMLPKCGGSALLVYSADGAPRQVLTTTTTTLTRIVIDHSWQLTELLTIETTAFKHEALSNSI